MNGDVTIQQHTLSVAVGRLRFLLNQANWVENFNKPVSNRDRQIDNDRTNLNISHLMGNFDSDGSLD